MVLFFFCRSFFARRSEKVTYKGFKIRRLSPTSFVDHFSSAERKMIDEQ